jgi:hypothetical protein
VDAQSASLALSVVAVGISLAALAWAIASYHLSGRRVKVRIECGSSRAYDANWEEFVTVVVTNIGRVPVRVRRLGVVYADLPFLWPEGHRQEAGQFGSFTLEPGFTEVSENFRPELGAPRRLTELVGVARLDDGKRVRSRGLMGTVFMTPKGTIWGPRYRVFTIDGDGSMLGPPGRRRRW